MQKCERETNILINQADLADGFFVFGTTEKAHYRRIIKRCGKGVLSEKQLGTPSCPYWQLKISARLLSRSTFGVRVHSTVEARAKHPPKRAPGAGFRGKNRKPAGVA